MQANYLKELTQAGIAWGFFSGATTGSAKYVLEKRLGLQAPVLVAMEDAPGKPDPTGLLQTVEMLEKSAPLSIVIYAGDTVADMYTVENARQIQPHRQWVGVGVLPPHVQEVEANALAYATRLQQAGATIVLKNVEELTPEKVAELVLKT